MGEVYRARDTSLGRDVAIKVLPERLQQDEEFRQRLRREAKSISQLQHPNICALYDIGHEDGVDFLVMELLDGETLEERLRRDRLSVPEALTLAARIASALERAHRQGVVHRDLKPGNVMLTTDGPKVLDFGLATEFASGGADPDTGSPTVLMTGQNMIAGTIHYMAPEQLHGQPVDARTDIFALGCVLHEMLSGKRPFDGESQASLIAAILDHEPPPLESLEVSSPPGLQRVIERCLAKEADERWQSSGDVRALLSDISAGEFSSAGTADSPVQPTTETTPNRSVMISAVAVAALGLLAAGWLAGRLTAPQPAERTRRVERYTVDDVAGAELMEISNPAMTNTGDKVAFIADAGRGLEVFLRRLDEIAAHPVEGTANAGWVTFSPDGEWLLFFDVLDRVLKKISIHGGMATALTEPSYLPAAWASDGYIYYTRERSGSSGTPDGKGLWRIAAAGGDPEQLTRALPQAGTVRHRGHYSPQLLPGGRKILFSEGDAFLHSGWNATVLNLETGDWQSVYEGVNQARIIAGNLVFWRDNRLWAAPFDLEQMKVLTVPKPVLDGVAQHPLAPLEVGQYQLTPTGDLIYLSGASEGEAIASLVAAPFAGEEIVLRSATAERLYSPRLSPDGSRVAFENCVNYTSSRAVECRSWVMDLTSGDLEPIGFGDFPVSPVWDPSGNALIYTEYNRDDGPHRIVRWPLDGGESTVLLEIDTEPVPVGSLPDGRLAYDVGSFPDVEIHLLSPDGSSRVLAEAGRQNATDLSPDGRWLVFHSSTRGQMDIWIFDLDDEQARPRQLTRTGASFGQFSPDGKSLYFRSRPYPGPAEILRAPFDPASGRLGKPESVMATPANAYTSSWWRYGQFAVTEDGLILPRLQTPRRNNRVVMVRNWTIELAEKLR
jgi:Tol biopolymer transport system component